MLKILGGLILNFSLLTGTVFAVNTASVVATPSIDVLTKDFPAQLVKEITDFVVESHKKGLSDEEILVMCQQLLKTVGNDVLGHPLAVEIKKSPTWLNSKVVVICLTVTLVVGCLTLLGFLMHEDRLENDRAQVQVLDAAVKVHAAHAQELAQHVVVRALPAEDFVTDRGCFSDDGDGDVVGSVGIDVGTQAGPAREHQMVTRHWYK